jgi:hypothetical protein
MRNRSKRYRNLGSEWSKIVRFNSQDYLMKSLYDDEFTSSDIDTEGPLSMTGTVLDELPWNRPVKKRTIVKVNEDFMDDFMDDLGLTADTEEEKQELIAQQVDDELASSLEYIFRTESGGEYTIKMSQDRFRNVIMFMLNSMTIISAGAIGESVEDFVYASGCLNGLFSYRLNVVGVKVVGGCPLFIISDFNQNGINNGYISVHFTEERDAVISVSYPGIAYKRPFSLITMPYDVFCEMLPADRITGKRKDPSEYYKMLMGRLIDKFQGIDAGLTLMKSNADSIKTGKTVEDPSVIKRNFTPIAKYSAKTPGDRSVLFSAMDIDIPQAEAFYQNSDEGCGSIQNTDDYFVMIAGSETYYERLMKSVWASPERGAAMNYHDYIHFRFFTRHPEIITKKVEHNAIIMPLANFITVLPALVMQMLG